jgi:hypothetical protein
MKKLLLGTVIGAVIAASVAALAGVVGRPPPANGGFRLMDSQWVLGVSQGVNNTYASGLTGAGTTQATATALPANTSMYELDTVGASTGFNLPFAFSGTRLSIYNATGTTATIYPAVTNNPVTAAQDTINSSTSTTILTHVKLTCAAAKDGVWGCQ